MERRRASRRVANMNDAIQQRDKRSVSREVYEYYGTLGFNVEKNEQPHIHIPNLLK